MWATSAVTMETDPAKSFAFNLRCHTPSLVDRDCIQTKLLSNACLEILGTTCVWALYTSGRLYHRFAEEENPRIGVYVSAESATA